MGDYERVLAAYLFLLALKNTGFEPANHDVDELWIQYCQGTNKDSIESNLLSLAFSQGFRL